MISRGPKPESRPGRVRAPKNAHYLQELHTYPNVTLVAAGGAGDKDKDQSGPRKFGLSKPVLAAVSPTLKDLLSQRDANADPDDSVTIVTEIEREHLELFVQFLLTGRLVRQRLDGGLKKSFLNLGLDLDQLRLELEVKQEGDAAWREARPEGRDDEEVTIVEQDCIVRQRPRENGNRAGVVRFCRTVREQTNALLGGGSKRIERKSEPLSREEPDFGFINIFCKDESNEALLQGYIECDVTVEEADFATVYEKKKKPAIFQPRKRKREAHPEKKRRNPYVRKHEIKHQCKYCHFTDRYSFDVRLHELKHESTNESHNFFCLYCEEGFETEEEQGKHIKANHPDRKLSCQYCGLKYSRGSHHHYQKHVAQHAGSSLLPCIQCGREFTRPRTLQLHSCDMGDYHDDSCPQCPSKSVTFRSYKEHMEHVDKVHGGKFKVVCGICPLAFDDETKMKDHQREVHPAGKRSTICEVCGLAVRTVVMKEHMHVEHGDGNPEVDDTSSWNIDTTKEHCDTCGKLIRKCWMKQHKYYVHNVGTRAERTELKGCQSRIMCTVCGKYIVKYAMNRHMEDAHGTEQLQCPKCPKILLSQRSLQNHLRLWHRTIPCEFCGKPQRNASMYKIHIASLHTKDGDKPFQCSSCPRGFASKRRLFEHENIHKNSRPYKCRFENCETAFNNIGNRSAHERSVHHGYKRPKRERNK